MSISLRRDPRGEELAKQAVKALAIEAADELWRAKGIRDCHGANVPFSGEKPHREIARVLISKARTINRAFKTFDEEIDCAVWSRERRG